MRVAAFVIAAALLMPCSAKSEEPAKPRPLLRWNYATLGGVVLVAVEQDASGNFAVTVSDPNVYQEYEYTIPRYEDGRLYRLHAWEIWKVAPKSPRRHMGVRDFDAPARYHRIAFFAATKRGGIPQWLEIREGSAGVIVEVATVLP